EAAKGLEFQDSSDKEYEDTGYGYYNPNLALTIVDEISMKMKKSFLNLLLTLKIQSSLKS
ncbi:17367_t:CDS:1, partial [Dentiscutata erythropus]